jgi:hypothetical protein
LRRGIFWMKKAPGRSIICIEGDEILKWSALVAVVLVLPSQRASAEICLTESARDAPFRSDPTVRALNQILSPGLAELGILFSDHVARLSDLALGVTENGRPLLMTEYTYFVEAGQSSVLHNLNRDQPEKIEALIQSLQDHLPGAVCGYSPCDGYGSGSTARFVNAGGVVRYSVSFWSGWDGSYDPTSYRFDLAYITVSTCEAN